MKDNKSKIFISVIVIFWVLFASFILIAASMYGMSLFGPQIRFLFIFLMVALPLLGIALIILVTRVRFKKALKVFLILTGASAIGVSVGGLLHNLLYALLIKLFGEGFWSNLGDEPVFFTFSVIVCPIALFVGVIGSLVLLAKKKIFE